jgi:hypothetical protein
MPITIRDTFGSDGCIVRICVGLTAVDVLQWRRSGRVVPAPIEFDALIDPGAEVSCVDSAAIRRLYPPTTTVIPTNAPSNSGLSFSPQYSVALTILDPQQVQGNNIVFPNATLTELNLNTVSLQSLIGRDLLAHCVFTYNGPPTHFHSATDHAVDPVN